jgi:hypothetical protein
VRRAVPQIRSYRRLTPMLPSVHAAILRRALEGVFTPQALNSIVASNVWMDAPWNQLGRDELHFDNNAFDRSSSYIAGQRALIRPALEGGRRRRAWQAFGRLTHTAQDFYAHSNYVELWLAREPNGMLPACTEIDPLDLGIMDSPALRSGRLHMPLGALSFVPGIAKWVDRMLPPDSHAHMNLDSAARGPAFEYAFHAAVKRTLYEYGLLTSGLPEPLAIQFRGLTV